MVAVYRDTNQRALRVLMMRDLDNLVSKIPAGPLRDQRAYLEEVMFLLMSHYGAEFRAVALQELEANRAARGEGSLPVVVAETAGRAQVSAAVGWALTMDDLRTALRGSALRLAQNPARETVRLSAVEAGRGFARVASMSACDFCTMLASRGAVYESKESASRSGMGRERTNAKQSPGEAFHDHCNCRVIEVRSTGDLPQSSIDLMREWKKATRDENGKIRPENGFELWKTYRAKKGEVAARAL